MKIYYTVEKDIFDDHQYFDVDGPDDYGYYAEKIADYYYSNCDGWEAHWPLVFTLWKDKDTLLGKFTVIMEAVPTFYAYKKKEEENAGENL